MSIRIWLPCILGLSILIMASGSSYGPCSNAKDCKASMKHEFSFSYVQAQNRLTKQKLEILKNAGEDLMYVAFTNPKDRETLTEIIETVHKSIEELDEPQLIDLKKSTEALTKANNLWRTIFDICGEMEHLQYYEKLIDQKIKFLNEILRIWKGSSRLMSVKTEEDEKKIDDITKEVKTIDEITSLLGKEKQVHNLLDQIFKYLELEDKIEN